MRVVALLFALALSIVPLTANAFPEAEYEQQGVCFDHADAVFPDALGGRVNNDAGFRNTRLHWHVQWLINNGTIQSRDELLGKCAIMWFQTVRDGNGNDHLFGFIQKDEPQAIRFVSTTEALGFSTEARRREYIEDQDFEAATQKGLGSSGSTTTHQGHRRGSDD